MTVKELVLGPAALTTREIGLKELEDDIYRPLESFPTARWWGAISVTGALAGVFVLCAWITVTQGIGESLIQNFAQYIWSRSHENV